MGKHKVMVSIDGRMAIFIVELLFKVKRKEKAVGESLDQRNNQIFTKEIMWMTKNMGLVSLDGPLAANIKANINTILSVDMG